MAITCYTLTANILYYFLVDCFFSILLLSKVDFHVKIVFLAELQILCFALLAFRQKIQIFLQVFCFKFFPLDLSFGHSQLFFQRFNLLNVCLLLISFFLQLIFKGYVFCFQTSHLFMSFYFFLNEFFVGLSKSAILFFEILYRINDVLSVVITIALTFLLLLISRIAEMIAFHILTFSAFDLF